MGTSAIGVPPACCGLCNWLTAQWDDNHEQREIDYVYCEKIDESAVVTRQDKRPAWCPLLENPAPLPHPDQEDYEELSYPE